jgi:hypothetical protein
MNNLTGPTKPGAEAARGRRILRAKNGFVDLRSTATGHPVAWGNHKGLPLQMESRFAILRK